MNNEIDFRDRRIKNTNGYTNGVLRQVYLKYSHTYLLNNDL